MRRWPEMFLIFLPSSLWVVIEHSCWIPFGWNRKRRQLILQDTVPDVHHNSKRHPENQATTSAQPQSRSATSVGAGPPCSPTPQACFCWAIGLANTDMIQVLLPALALSNFHKMASPHNKRQGKKKKKKPNPRPFYISLFNEKKKAPSYTVNTHHWKEQQVAKEVV